MSVAACVCAAVLCALWWAARWRERARTRQLAARMPGPRAWPVVGNALMFLAKPDELLTRLMDFINQYGEYCRLWIGPDLLVFVKNPADIRLLLTGNKINEKGPFYKIMKTYVGPGVLTEGGPLWRSHRKLAASSFNKHAVERFCAVFNDCGEELAGALASRQPGVTFNVYHDMVMFTTLSVCQAIMGLSKEDSQNIKSMDELVRETHNLYDFVNTNMVRWWLHIPLVYWLSGRKAEERYYLKLIDEMTSDIVTKRREALKTSLPEKPSLVDSFILSGELSEEDLKFETMTFFTASQEATAKIASMVLLILAHLPEWQDKVYNEIVDVLGVEDDSVTGGQWKELKMLDAVYKEAIRYMPIGAFIQRTVEDEVTICNGEITLPTGSNVVIPIHAVHRDPRYWTRPDRVDPGRFLPGGGARDPNAYLPFSLGAMDCIGRLYGESLVKVLVIRSLRRVQVEADGRIEDLELNVAISVKLAKGYNLRVKPRENIRLE